MGITQRNDQFGWLTFNTVNVISCACPSISRLASVKTNYIQIFGDDVKNYLSLASSESIGWGSGFNTTYLKYTRFVLWYAILRSDSSDLSNRSKLGSRFGRIDVDLLPYFKTIWALNTQPRVGVFVRFYLDMPYVIFEHGAWFSGVCY